MCCEDLWVVLVGLSLANCRTGSILRQFEALPLKENILFTSGLIMLDVLYILYGKLKDLRHLNGLACFNFLLLFLPTMQSFSIFLTNWWTCTQIIL